MAVGYRLSAFVLHIRKAEVRQPVAEVNLNNYEKHFKANH